MACSRGRSRLSLTEEDARCCFAPLYFYRVACTAAEAKDNSNLSTTTTPTATTTTTTTTTRRVSDPKAGAGGGEDESTAAASANADATSVTADSGDTTLWEQMTAREGRDAARPAGMRAGDWQAERQLQEALRESRQEADTTGGASAPSGNGKSGEERSFIDAGFHALATDAVDGEEGKSASSSDGQKLAPRNADDANGKGRGRTAMMDSNGGAVAARRGAAAAAGDNANDTQGMIGSEEGREAGEEEDEDFGNVELVVTKDGRIIPGAAVAAVVGDYVAVAVLESENSQTEGRGVRNDGVGVGIDEGGGASAGGIVHSAVSKGQETDEGEEGEGDAEGEEDEEEEEPLPPDIMLTLADDVLHRIMLFLNPEEIFECRAVSSRWDFPGHEAVFEGLCRRTYLAQSAKKLLNVKRWRSWQRMFKFRPRLRDTGLYSLKTTYFKKPVRDMSTDWTPGKVLRVTYYRYFRFFGDGRVAYGLTHDNPREFVRMMQEGSPKVVYGTYTISKWEVKVEIPNPWSWVNFTLQLANGERGRFTHLVMLRHSSVPRNDTRVGRCHHSVKSTDFFTFRRVWQF